MQGVPATCQAVLKKFIAVNKANDVSVVIDCIFRKRHTLLLHFLDFPFRDNCLEEKTHSPAFISLSLHSPPRSGFNAHMLFVLMQELFYFLHRFSFCLPGPPCSIHIINTGHFIILESLPGFCGTTFP